MFTMSSYPETLHAMTGNDFFSKNHPKISKIVQNYSKMAKIAYPTHHVIFWHSMCDGHDFNAFGGWNKSF